MKLYLSSYKVGNKTEELKRWISEHGNKICLIPNSRDIYPESERKSKGIQKDVNELADIGFDVTVISLKDYFEDKEGLSSRLEEFNAFYVIGGNTFALRQAMYLSGFDKYLKTIENNPNYLYAGYSAGICVLAKDMHGLEICDDSSINPYGIDTIWNGLGYFDYIFLPHYKSNHKETELIDEAVKYCNKHNIKYKTLCDGDVIIQEIGKKSENLTSENNILLNIKEGINIELVKYIENEIFPLYKRNEEGHGIEHIKTVIKRSLKFAKQYNADLDMAYTIAAYHDIGHYIDRKRHEIISAEIFMEDEKIKRWFTDEQRNIIKEAIEDHRASSDHKPRSIYGMIVSTADRTIADINNIIKRTYSYGKRNYIGLSEEEQINEVYQYIKKKYGESGCVKIYLEDKEFDEAIEKLRQALSNKEEFIERIKNVIN